MIITGHIGKHQLTVSYRKMQTQTGINSKLADGQHILMWDFDDTSLAKLVAALKDIQEEYHLPAIHILKTNKYAGYHAYCLKRCSFLKALHILSASFYIDQAFLRIGACRGFWTLRISPKKGVEPYHVKTLPSEETRPDNVEFEELTNLVEYRTKLDKSIAEKVFRINAGNKRK